MGPPYDAQNNAKARHANNGHVVHRAHLFTVCTGTVSGIPARNMAMRHSLARCDEGPRTLPMTTSPTSAAATPVLANVALNNVASMSSAGVLERPPRRACVEVHRYGLSCSCGGLCSSCPMATTWYDGTHSNTKAAVPSPPHMTNRYPLSQSATNGHPHSPTAHLIASHAGDDAFATVTGNSYTAEEARKQLFCILCTAFTAPCPL